MPSGVVTRKHAVLPAVPPIKYSCKKSESDKASRLKLPVYRKNRIMLNDTTGIESEKSRMWETLRDK